MIDFDGPFLGGLGLFFGGGLPDSHPCGGGGDRSPFFCRGGGLVGFQRQVLGPFLFLNTNPPAPTSLEIFKREFGSTKNDQDRSPNPLPHFYGSFSRGSRRGPAKVEPLTGPRWKRHPPPNVPKLRRLGFWLFLLGGGPKSSFCVPGGESCSTPPLQKNSSYKK